MTDTYFDAATCKVADVLQAIDDAGYVVLLNALPGDRLAALRGELEPHFEHRPASQAWFFGFNTTRIEALFRKSIITQEMAVHETVLAIADHVLGPNCDSYQINLTQGIRIHPGERAQILHPDSALFPISDKPFEFQLNALWAYSDFTKENGGTVLVPGSHKWPEDRKPTAEEMTAASMPAGSVLVYAASLLHGGGANVTAKPRTGIAISYCLGWLRQSENQYLSYPPGIARQFSEQLQRLIGYSVHRPNLGWVYGHDPIQLLKPGEIGHEGAKDFLTPQQIELLKEYYGNEAVSLTSHNLHAA
jgi:ectoine hydroxylase-related dioxygenase (phytanoyl-CoA dioxygenase family)